MPAAFNNVHIFDLTLAEWTSPSDIQVFSTFTFNSVTVVTNGGGGGNGGDDLVVLM